jgi:hypothetical protein
MLSVTVDLVSLFVVMRIGRAVGGRGLYPPVGSGRSIRWSFGTLERLDHALSLCSSPHLPCTRIQ